MARGSELDCALESSGSRPASPPSCGAPPHFPHRSPRPDNLMPHGGLRDEEPPDSPGRLRASSALRRAARPPFSPTPAQLVAAHHGLSLARGRPRRNRMGVRRNGSLLARVASTALRRASSRRIDEWALRRVCEGCDRPPPPAPPARIQTSSPAVLLPALVRPLLAGRFFFGAGGWCMTPAEVKPETRARPLAGRYSGFRGPVFGPAFAGRNQRVFFWFSGFRLELGVPNPTCCV